MGETKIEWTAYANESGEMVQGYTFNPWVGCSKISAGCKFCYAEHLIDTRYKRGAWGVNGTRQKTKTWRKPLTWQKQAAALNVRPKVFCASLADVFEDNAQLIDWRIELFEQIITQTPNLDWLLLTKRPEVAKRFFEENPQFANLPNVWLGTSVENQEQADLRIPILLSIPARVRFLSCEPLLGDLDLKDYLSPNEIDYCPNCDWEPVNTITLINTQPFEFCKICEDCESRTERLINRPAIDWVIVGGESGHSARPLHPDWVRSIQAQCEESGVAFFFKQWGEYLPYCQLSSGMLETKTYLFPSPYNPEKANRYLKLGKHQAGALLDGKEYREFPKL